MGGLKLTPEAFLKLFALKSGRWPVLEEVLFSHPMAAEVRCQKNFCWENQQQWLDSQHLPLSGTGTPRHQPCLGAQDWCGLTLCGAGGAAYMSPSSVGSDGAADLTPLCSQGSVVRRGPRQWGSSVSESLPEQTSIVTGALWLAALPSGVPALAGPVGLGSAVGHLGQGRVGDTDQGCRGSTVGHGAPLSHHH